MKPRNRACALRTKRRRAFVPHSNDVSVDRVGNVMADDVELAKVYARSIYDEFSWVEMVIIPRDSIVTVIES